MSLYLAHLGHFPKFQLKMQPISETQTQVYLFPSSFPRMAILTILRKIELVQLLSSLVALDQSDQSKIAKCL